MRIFQIVKNPLRSLANGKKILDIPKPEKTELWFWDRGHWLMVKRQRERLSMIPCSAY
jgi:hypothetical protein